MTPARVLVGLLCLAHYANGFSGITSLARSVAQGPASVWHRSLVSATSLTYPEAKGCGKRCGRNIVQATDGVEGEANGLRETEGTEGESGEAGEAGGDVSLSAEVGAGGAMVLVENPDRGNVLTRAMKAVSRFFSGGKDKPDLKALGLYALLSYGFVSNVSYAVLTGIAWFASSKKSGLSPLAPDQWGLFMVCWTGLWAVNNILREGQRGRDRHLRLHRQRGRDVHPHGRGDPPGLGALRRSYLASDSCHLSQVVVMPSFSEWKISACRAPTAVCALALSLLLQG
ncbi:unnamed protein product [Discosporangium mesarthrocarpum]